MKWIQLSFRRTIASALATFLVLPMFLPAIAVAQTAPNSIVYNDVDALSDTSGSPTVDMEQPAQEYVIDEPAPVAESALPSDSEQEAPAPDSIASDISDNPVEPDAPADIVEPDTTAEPETDVAPAGDESNLAPDVDNDTNETAPNADSNNEGAADTPSAPEQVEPAVDSPASSVEPAALNEIETTNEGPVTIEPTFTVAAAMSGAIWTTDKDGTVNQNVSYPNKPAVWLNGGPPNKTCGSGNGLPNGKYHWKIESPNGELLGDSGGKTVAVTDGCLGSINLWDWNPPASHYLDTPNNGGEYKVSISTDPTFPGGLTKSDTFKVRKEPGASITKVDSIDPIEVDENTVYTLTVKNTGNTDMIGHYVVDTLPDGLEYVSSNPPAAVTSSSKTLTWQLDRMVSNDTATFTVEVKGKIVGPHENVAKVHRASGQVSAQTNEWTTVKAPPGVPHISINKRDSVDPIMLKENTVYTLRIANDGDTPLTNVEVTDFLPTGMTYVSSDPAATVSGSKLTWSLGTMAVQEVREITVEVTGDVKGSHKNRASVCATEVTESTTVSGDGPVSIQTFTECLDVRSVASGDDVECPEPPRTVCDEATEWTEVIDPGLTKVDSKDPIYVGEQVTYTITFTNTGTATLTNRTVVDTLPADMEYVSSNPVATVTDSSKTLTWSVTTLDGGASTTFDVTVIAEATGTHTNKVDVGNKHAEEDTTVRQPGVKITKGDSVDPIMVGEDTVYTITVENTGDTTLTGVTVSDLLPAGMTFISASESYTGPVLGVYTVSLPDLGVGATDSFTVTAKGNAKGTHTNNANVLTNEGAEDKTDEPTEVIDPGLTKTDSVDPVYLEKDTSYTITFTNTGTATLTNRVVVDTLPANMEYISSSPAAVVTDSSKTLSWNVASLAGGASAVFVVEVKAKATGVHTNKVDVGDKHAEEKTTVQQPAIGITKTDSVDPILTGEQTVYTLTVTNEGGAPLTNVEVSDTLPAGLGYVSSDPTATVNDKTLTWSLGNLAVQGQETIEVTVNGDATGTHTNNVSVTADEEVGAEADEDTTVNEPPITKEDDVDPVNVGDEFTYTITFTNTGEADLLDRTLVDTLPDGMDYVSSSPAATVNGQQLTWNIDKIEGGETIVYTVTVAATEAGIHNNTVTLGDWDAEEETTVKQPAVTITKSDSIDPIRIGENTQYTLTVTNTGDTELNNVTVSDPLPAGMAYVSSGPSASNVSGQNVEWDLGTLAIDEKRTLTVTVSGVSAGSHTNIASVSTEEGVSDKDDEDTLILTPNASASITKVDSVDPIMAGESTDYTIVVTNTGDTTLTKVRLSDTLPGTFSFVSSTMENEVDNGDLVWDLGTLAPGEVVSVNVTAQSSLFGEYTNVAEVDATELDQPEIADEKTIVEIKPLGGELEITKVDDVDPVQVGETVTYTIKVTNTGKIKLTNLKVTDMLPDGLEYKSSDVALTQGGSSQLTASFGDLDPGESTTFKVVTTATKSGSVTNTVQASADEAAGTAVESTLVGDVIASADPVPPAPALPATGFPVMIWWLTALGVIVAGLGLEISTRRRRLMQN